MSAEGDVDNIIKPILDALKGIFYPDDDLIAAVQAARFDLRKDLDLRLDTLPEHIASALTSSLTSNHTLFIEVGPAPEQTFSTGVVQ